MTGKGILFTGGSGLLGSEFQKLLPDADYPGSQVFNVTDLEQMDAYLQSKAVTTIVHAAAFTSPPKVEQDPARAIDVNIIGTANVVKLCRKYQCRLVYISTDYVFKGDQGNYKEDDPVCPVNKYAWSKLGGECSVRLYDRSLIIRTTFGPNSFPYPKAFVDQWTSRECVRVIARKILPVLNRELNGILHVGGGRKTVFEYAKSLDPAKDIAPLSIQDIHFSVPGDTSLCVEKYNTLIEGGEK